MTSHCPLCGSEQHVIVYKQMQQYGGADIVKCSHCGHMYTQFTGTIETDDLYNDNDAVYKVIENRDSVYDKILNHEYAGVVRQIKKLNTNTTGNLLDFGCGKGKFGSIAKANGWQVKCVETSPERAAYAKNVYGLEVNSEFYSSGNIFNTWFDVLTLFHVLEHLPEPAPLLTQLIKDNLTKAAIVVVEVPNMGSFQSAIAKDKWIHLDVPRHIHHFTPERLEKFLEEVGLKTVKKTFFSFHLGVLGMVDSLLKIFGYKKNIIYELKNKKSKSLLIKIALLMPFALAMEGIASAVGKGGVVRLYLRRK